MKLEQLTQFCDSKDGRVFCARPYTLDGMSYATDGKILVRLDSAVETDPLDDRDNQAAKKAQAWCADIPKIGFVPLVAELPEVVQLPCDTCSGSGMVTAPEMQDCDDCDGDGEFRHGRHRYACANCDGTGEIKCRDGKSGELMECKVCNGGGISRELVKVAVSGKNFQAKYLAKLLALPGIEYMLDESGNHKMIFRFSGGVGILMGTL